jgi:isopentenyldiphosphate isomerase
LHAARTARPTPEVDTVAGPEGKVIRTILAALSYFADQVLHSAPDEVERGEWCSVEEVHTLIQQLATTGEVAHA